MLLLFSPVDSHWRECVSAAKNLCRREKGRLKTNVSIENTRLVGGSYFECLGCFSIIFSIAMLFHPTFP